jgi:calcineurin-like phosphoesterase family protein
MRGGLIFTHVPVHPSCLSGHYLGNVHGHLHCHLILDNGQVDRKYYNACVERNDFTPVPLDLIKDFFRGNGRAQAHV